MGQRKYALNAHTTTLAPAAERLVRPRRPAASIPLAERRRYKGVRRESKEGVGGTRNPPIPPWPPEAATRLLTQPNAAQERAPKPAKQRKNAEQHTYPFAPAAERRASTRRERRKTTPPCNNRRTRLKREKAKALSHPPGGICDKISNLSPCAAVRAESVIANGTWM